MCALCDMFVRSKRYLGTRGMRGAKSLGSGKTGVDCDRVRLPLDGGGGLLRQEKSDRHRLPCFGAAAEGATDFSFLPLPPLASLPFFSSTLTASPVCTPAAAAARVTGAPAKETSSSPRRPPLGEDGGDVIGEARYSPAEGGPSTSSTKYASPARPSCTRFN